ncbi:MAG: CHASE2 domain-containing protein [Desulfarculus sp.]|nr:CHASE2 domain-containing protein [Desulfarculus sp.]
MGQRLTKLGRLVSGKGGLFIISAGLLLTLMMAAVYIWQPTFLVFLDHKAYDTMLRALGPTPPSDRIVIVDVDEASVARKGQWPWPRYRVARLLDKLRELGAAVVAIDFLLSEPDRTSLATIQEEMSRELGVPIQVSPADPQWLDNDRILSAALRQGPFVLGMKFLFGQNRRSGSQDCLLRPVAVVRRHTQGQAPSSPPWFQASGVACNLPSISSAVRRMGFVDVGLDSDGVLRRVPLLMQYQDQLYPSLALAAYLQTRGLNQLVIHLSALGTQALQIKENLVPVDAQAQLLINYRGPAGTFSFLPAADVLDGNVAGELVAGKVVLVGTSAAGLKDLRATPLHSGTSGVEIHANVLDNLIQGDYITKPAYAPGLALALVLACGLVSTLLLARLRALGSLLTSAGGAALVLGACAWSLRDAGLYWSPLWPTLTLAVNFSMLSLARFWREELLVKKRTEELAITQQATIISLASLAETRDNETGAHIKRTQLYVKALARHLKNRPGYGQDLDETYIEQLVNCAPLHDIGKVGVRDFVLLKPGRLTPGEFEEMKKHTTYGLEALKRAERDLGDKSFLRMACEMAHSHHERWDGQGYPQGLRGDSIPLAGRLMAVADVYDALVSPRVYKPALSHEQAVEIIREGQGTQFDPEVVAAFLAVQQEFCVIATELADPHQECETPAEEAASRQTRP